MITIEEVQAKGITRQFTLPAEYEQRWIEFFDWLVAHGEIVEFRVL